MAKSTQKPKNSKSNEKKSGGNNFFAPIIEGQTYLNMLYLLFSFPLGIFYFVFLVTGLAVGISLGVTLTWLGVPLLLGVFFSWRGLAIFERMQAKYLLDTEIVYVPNKQSKNKGVWQKIKEHLNDATSWKEFAALIIKFPLGIISFVFLVTFLATSFALIAAPIILYLANIAIISEGISVPANMVFMRTFWFTGIAAIVGILLLFVSLHIFNFLAKLSGIIFKALLEKRK